MPWIVEHSSLSLSLLTDTHIHSTHKHMHIFHLVDKGFVFIGVNALKEHISSRLLSFSFDYQLCLIPRVVVVVASSGARVRDRYGDGERGIHTEAVVRAVMGLVVVMVRDGRGGGGRGHYTDVAISDGGVMVVGVVISFAFCTSAMLDT